MNVIFDKEVQATAHVRCQSSQPSLASILVNQGIQVIINYQPINPIL